MKSYEFDLFKDFFGFYLKEKSYDQKTKKKLTLSGLAGRLGYSSASSLSMVASGERLPTDPLLNALFEEWQIPFPERERIRLKVHIEKKERKGKSAYQLVSKLSQISPYHKIDVKKFALMRDWYVMVIRIMAGTPDFDEDPQVISHKLRKKISPAQAKKALSLLEEQGLLVRDPVTKKLQQAQENVETTNGIPSEAIREHHKGMLERAIDSIEEQGVAQRTLNAHTFQFDMKDMEKAQAEITNFVKQFHAKYNSNLSKNIYQLNVQFFEHSNGGTKNDN